MFLLACFRFYKAALIRGSYHLLAVVESVIIRLFMVCRDRKKVMIIRCSYLFIGCRKICENLIVLWFTGIVKKLWNVIPLLEFSGHITCRKMILLAWPDARPEMIRRF